jgi:hypothetical protein
MAAILPSIPAGTRADERYEGEAHRHEEYGRKMVEAAFA